VGGLLRDTRDRRELHRSDGAARQLRRNERTELALLPRGRVRSVRVRWLTKCARRGDGHLVAHCFTFDCQSVRVPVLMYVHLMPCRCRMVLSTSTSLARPTSARLAALYSCGVARARVCVCVCARDAGDADRAGSRRLACPIFESVCCSCGTNGRCVNGQCFCADGACARVVRAYVSVHGVTVSQATQAPRVRRRSRRGGAYRHILTARTEMCAQCCASALRRSRNRPAR
jgi:hypothetical protein